MPLKLPLATVQLHQLMAVPLNLQKLGQKLTLYHLQKLTPSQVTIDFAERKWYDQAGDIANMSDLFGMVPDEYENVIVDSDEEKKCKKEAKQLAQTVKEEAKETTVKKEWLSQVKKEKCEEKQHDPQPNGLKRKYSTGTGKGYASSPRPPLAKATMSTASTEQKKTAPATPVASPSGSAKKAEEKRTAPATPVPTYCQEGSDCKGDKGYRVSYCNEGGSTSMSSASMPPPSIVPKKLEHGWLDKCVASAAMVEAGNGARAQALIQVYQKSNGLKNVFEQHTALLKTAAKDPKRAYVLFHTD